MAIVNLTQHAATAEQLADGVVEPPAEMKERVKSLLTFDAIPTSKEIREVAKQLAALVLGQDAAMIGGAPFLMGALEAALVNVGVEPLYAFSRRESVEEVQADGSVRKVNVFRHCGWVAP